MYYTQKLFVRGVKKILEKKIKRLNLKKLVNWDGDNFKFKTNLLWNSGVYFKSKIIDNFMDIIKQVLRETKKQMIFTWYIYHSDDIYLYIFFFFLLHTDIFFLATFFYYPLQSHQYFCEESHQMGKKCTWEICISYI